MFGSTSRTHSRRLSDVGLAYSTAPYRLTFDDGRGFHLIVASEYLLRNRIETADQSR